MLSLNTSETPYEIDIGIEDWSHFKMKDGKFRRQFEGSMKGIFEIQKHPTDSSKDKLKWCFAMPGKPRPADFSAEP